MLKVDKVGENNESSTKIERGPSLSPIDFDTFNRKENTHAYVRR